MTEERPTEPTPAPETPPPASAPPAYSPPTYTPPPVPPPAMPQPAVAWAPPPAATAAALGRRTTLSLAAGILLVVLGVLGALFSLAVLTIGREVVKQFDFSGLPGFDGGDPNAIVASVITFLGIFVLACSAFYIVGGVGVMRSANWGRVIGIIIGILAGLIWLGSLVSSGRAGRASDPTFALVLLVTHAYIAISLLFFWRNKAPAG